MEEEAAAERDLLIETLQSEQLEMDWEHFQEDLAKLPPAGQCLNYGCENETSSGQQICTSCEHSTMFRAA